MEDKTKDEIMSELREKHFALSGADVILKTLEALKFIEKCPEGDITSPFQKAKRNIKTPIQNVVNRFPKKNRPSEPSKLYEDNDKFSITEKGRQKLKVSELKETLYQSQKRDLQRVEDVELTTETLYRFWTDIDADSNIQSYKFQKYFYVNGENQNTFFDEDDQPILLAKFKLDNFKAELNLENIYEEGIDRNSVREINKYEEINEIIEFSNNFIYIYPTGVGIFTSQVTIKDYESIRPVKNIIENKIKKIFLDKFEITSSKESDIITKLKKFRKAILYLDRFRLVDSFHLELSKINKPAWIHITYWFYNDEFFEGNMEGAMTLKTKFLPLVVDLLEHNPENILVLKNRLAIYGWGRSVVLTNKRNIEIETWVRNKVNLIEIGQYSIFGHILLDSLLRKVIGKLNFEIPSTKHSYKKLEDNIELLNKTILASNVYMEELQTGINNILRAGSLSFINTLERHWRLDKIEQNNRKKLESLNAQRSSFEQTLISYKQDRMNTVSTAFTGMGIAAVIDCSCRFKSIKIMDNCP